MMLTAPCYQCPDRHDLCHGHCEKYLEFKAKHEAEKMAHYEDKRIGDFIVALNNKAAHTRKDGSKRR